MSVINKYYAVSIDTKTTITDENNGIVNGVFRLITGRSVYDSSTVDKILLGDFCNVKIELTDSEMNDMSTAMQSGTLYQSSSDFKAVNTVPTNSSTFAVTKDYGSSYSGTALYIAKGSDIVKGDIFKVVDNTASNEVFEYVSINKWFTNHIPSDGIGEATRGVDIGTVGKYGTVSSFNFKLDNSEGLYNFLESHEIFLSKSEVKSFVIIDGLAFQFWAGIIDKMTQYESILKVACKDNYNNIHKIIPPNIISETEFPKVNSGNLGKTIPVVLGNVAYSPIVSIDSMRPIHECGVVFHYTVSDGWMLIESHGAGGVDNQDIYVRIVGAPNPDEVYKINPSKKFLWNHGYWAFDTWMDQRVGNVSQSDFDNNYMPSEGVEKDFIPSTSWFMQRVEIDIRQLITNKDFYRLEDTATPPKVFSYNKTTDKYVDISGAVDNYYRTNSNSSTDPNTPYPFVNVKAGQSDMKGLLRWYNPREVIFNGVDQVYCFKFVDTATKGQTITPVYSRSVTVTGTADSLLDKDRTTYLECKLNTGGSGQYNGIVYERRFNASLFQGVKNANFVIDISARTVNAGGTGYHKMLGVKICFMDRYFKEVLSNNIPKYPDWQTLHTATAETDLILTPKGYCTNDGGFTSGWGRMLDIYEDDGTIVPQNSIYVTKIDDKMIEMFNNKEVAYVKLQILNFDPSGLTEETLPSLKIRQIAILEDVEVDTMGDDLYTRVLGGEWESYLNTTVTPYRIIKHLLENYDNIDIDKIDYGNLKSKRDATWNTGRTLIEQKNSREYLDSLLRETWIALVVDRLGKRKLSAWLDNTEVKFSHDGDEIIKESFKQTTKTNIDKIYTHYNIKYAYNPGADRYDKTFFIANTDQDTFPEPLDGGTLPPDGRDWRKYVGGLPETSYATAKAIWDQAHEAYNKTGVIHQLPRNLSECDWIQDAELFTLFNDGVGINSVAWKYLESMVAWNGSAKNTFEYSIPISKDNIKIDLLDFGGVKDFILTKDELRYGWIMRYTVSPKENSIKIRLISKPELYDNAPKYIIEHGTGEFTDTITEHGTGSFTDTITEA